VFAIAAAHEQKQKKLARYESQLLVKDFGTHVITGIEAGASLEQVRSQALVSRDLSRGVTYAKSPTHCLRNL
jgi:hypothetical protein